MRKCRIFLGVFLLLGILLNSAGCFQRTRYIVFSDKKHIITQVSCTDRDCIGIVLDNAELLVCDYKGHELCRKQFEKSINQLDISLESVLLQYADDSIELYRLENNDMELKIRREFTSPVKSAEIVSRTRELDGLIVLLENGDLYLFKDQSDSKDCLPLDEHVKTVACLYDHFVYIKDNGKVELIWQGSSDACETDIDPEIARDIKELKLARFNGKEGFLGIGTDQVCYLSGIAPLSLDTGTDITNINTDSVLSGKGVDYSVVYQENGKWYYEGMRRDYESDINHENRRRIKPKDGESMIPIPGGVIFYTDHEVRIQLI